MHLRCTQTLQAAVIKQALPKTLEDCGVGEGDFREGFLGTGLLKQNLKKKKNHPQGLSTAVLGSVGVGSSGRRR